MEKQIINKLTEILAERHPGTNFRISFHDGIPGRKHIIVAAYGNDWTGPQINKTIKEIVPTPLSYFRSGKTFFIYLPKEGS